MNDRAYPKKEDQARGQRDLKHAYDGLQQWAVEVVLRSKEDGSARGVCAVPGKASCIYEDCCDHPIWGYREVQESLRAATHHQPPSLA